MENGEKNACEHSADSPSGHFNKAIWTQVQEARYSAPEIGKILLSCYIWDFQCQKPLRSAAITE